MKKSRSKVVIETSDDASLTQLQRLGAAAFRSRRRLATALAVVIAVFLGYHVIFGQNGITIYEQKRLEDRTLSREILELQSQNAALTAHVRRLKNSRDAIEHEAREKLHYTRPGEIIYTLNDKPGDDDRLASNTAAASKSQPVDAAAVAPKP
ncbi:MAG TPA: septum formation initiator family protein [Acidisarcina sp.]